MGVCRHCQREMRTAVGCKKVPITHHGKKYDPIKVGCEGDFFEGMGDGRCGDCGAKPGHYHHSGCDCERCPVCGGQLISCHCEDAYNNYNVAAERPSAPPADLPELLNLAAKNLATIAYIDEAMRAEGDIWYRFLRVPVNSGYAIYQIAHATKSHVNLSICMLGGSLPPKDEWQNAGFKYDRIDSKWGMAARVTRNRVEKLLKIQDAMELDWKKLKTSLLED